MNRYQSAHLSVVLLAAAIAGPTQAQQLAITNVNVVPMTSDTVLRQHTVLVNDDRITSIIPSTQWTTPSADTIDGASGFLIPGLWDMHAHVFRAGNMDEVFRQLVRHGVLGVRDMNSPVSLDSIHKLRSSVVNGQLEAPYIAAPGPLLDAPGRSANEMSPAIREVRNQEEVREAVRELQAEGADFIKVYNRMSEQMLRAALAEGDALDIPVAGHVPMPIAASVLSDLGMASQEHLQGILAESSDAGDEFREFAATAMQGDPTREIIARFVELRMRMVAEYSTERAEKLFATLHRNGTAITPTLVSNRGFLFGGFDENLTADPRFEAMDVSMRMAWNQPNPIAGLMSEETRADWFGRLGQIVGELNDQDVMLLAGTDLGVPWVYPGSSLHDELVLMQQAGLTPYEALTTATRAAARFLGLEDMGTLEEGSVADLVLLSANPLSDVAAVRDVQIVVLRGSPIHP